MKHSQKSGRFIAPHHQNKHGLSDLFSAGRIGCGQHFPSTLANQLGPYASTSPSSSPSLGLFVQAPESARRRRVLSPPLSLLSRPPSISLGLIRPLNFPISHIDCMSSHSQWGSGPSSPLISFHGARIPSKAFSFSGSITPSSSHLHVAVYLLDSSHITIQWSWRLWQVGSYSSMDYRGSKAKFQES
jgi:hypothetical protein